ncbi:hypothetical protein ABFS82_03G047100 [Erythranthe guttata]
MEKESSFTLTISDLIQRAQPLTAAASLVPSRPISTLGPHNNSDENHRRKSSSDTCRNTGLQTLKPLNQPTPLIGTLTLPSIPKSSSRIKCNCFQFSDDSATICCGILDFDPKMIDQRIRVLAWNFIPLQCGDGGVKGGFLEIITWEFCRSFSGNVCSLSDFGSFCLTLGGCDVNENSAANCLMFGLIESISPVSVVPCAGGETGSRNISGFLANVRVCKCKICAAKLLVSQLKDLSEENVGDHSFTKTVIVYFCGLTSAWHPVISRFIGGIVLLTGLKKKLVFISKEVSQLMYVTTDEASFHIAKLFKQRGFVCNSDVRGEGECGSYTGIVTGLYMQGMVVELDQDVILLLTEQHLTVPHCVRVGAIVTLKNVHFVDPKFRWGKMLILGACCRTSVYVESFSPLETGCHSRSCSPSSLQKCINSLSFAARLWALLVISCFGKKFAGILSEKEIFGSKHNEGLAQKYASSYLPTSAFQIRQGLMLEFCKHNLCSVGNEAHYGHLRLVLPIANLISYYEASWKKILDDQDNFSGLVYDSNQKKPLCCEGRSYVQSVKRVFHTEEIGVLVLGTLKVSLSSGKLQLVDATGYIDIMTDLPTTWDFDRIFEAKKFRLIIEGIPPKLVDLDSTIHQPLSCRSIFSNDLPLEKMKTSIYLYADKDSRSCSLFFDSKGNSHELENGKYHLIMLTHKFPIQQKFQGDLAKLSNIFAEAIVLPWDLLVAGKYEDTVTNYVENITRPEKHRSNKRCKVEQACVDASNIGLNESMNRLRGQFTLKTCASNHPIELPCLIASKGKKIHYHAKMVSVCKPSKRKVLLEFSPDSLCVYEVMKIGCCYLIKHHEEDNLRPRKENPQISRAKLSISSENRVRKVRFSSIETLRNSDVFPSCNLHNSSDEIILEGPHRVEISGLDSDVHSDINVFVPSGDVTLLEKAIKDSSSEESDIHGHGEPMTNASVCHTLPEGNLITLQGVVMSFHDCSGDNCPVPGQGYLPMFLRGNGGVCFHVLVDNQTLRIFCDLSKQTYPVGLGTNVYATFHRILVLSAQNRYVMTPVSFITIKDTILTNGHLTDEFNDPSRTGTETVGLFSVASPNTVPTILISDALQLSELKPLKFRCRIVGVYTLVFEKTKTTAVSRSCFGIPFAGFIIDDGSSSCCCWVDSERAKALLGLEFEDHLRKDSAESFGRSKARKRSNIGRLNRVLERHNRIVVKNYGHIFDPSSQQLAFLVNSDKSLRSSDEDLLRNSINYAFLRPSWTIVGNLMDEKTSNWLGERLMELDILFPSLLNVWLTSICHTDMLAEARNIIQELV